MYNQQIIKKSLKQIVGDIDIHLETPSDPAHGDYSTNIAMLLSSGSLTAEILADSDRRPSKNFEDSDPKKTANLIIQKLSKDKSLSEIVSKIEVAGPGFINFWLSPAALFNNLQAILKEGNNFGKSTSLKSKKIMVEFAHPNTHKELHIGHMRTLMLGECLSRLFEANGAEVFRANYQGDIGPHVAKAIWGTQKLLIEQNLTWEQAEKLDPCKRAHLLGQGYIKGNKEYDQNSQEITQINLQLYAKQQPLWDIYQRTRRWSLEYYDLFYERFDTKFDKLYFESEMADEGKQIVLQNIGKVFQKSEGAVIFDGEPFGLHKRVFITKDGYPTYEGKDMALARHQYADFPFNKIIHVVANEQADYFKVVFKALEALDPKFGKSQEHLSMGMVRLIGMKMSSRTGVLVTVDDLLDQVKDKVKEQMVDSDLTKTQFSEVAEAVTLGAVKYAFLKVNPEAELAFDIKKSVDIHGNSGPYLQYTYARTQSVLKKATVKPAVETSTPNSEESMLLRHLSQFPEIIIAASKNYSPHTLCTYLYELAQAFNTFYNKHQIINSDSQAFRLALAATTAQVLSHGLHLLGIAAPEKM